MIYIEILLLIAALSLDSLAASVSFGLSKIKISIFQSIIISLVCSVILSASLALSGAISELLPIWVTTPKKLSATETLLFAISMSIDGLAAGFGAGLAAEDNILTVGITSCVITFLTVYIGNKEGLRVNRQAPEVIQKIGGIVIIAVAVCKLI